MIVPMKMISIVVLDSLRVASLEQLRNVGVLHLHSAEPSGEELSRLEELRAHFERALVLMPAGEKKGVKPEADLAACTQAADRVLALTERLRELKEELSRLERSKVTIADWGDFRPADVIELAQKGIRLRLFSMRKDEFAALPGELPVFTIKETKKNALVAVVQLQSAGAAEAGTVDADAAEVDTAIPGIETPLPQAGLSEIHEDMERARSELADIDEQWARLSESQALIQSGVHKLDVLIEFESARAGMGVDGPLAYITGYAPAETVADLEETARAQGWALLVQEPDEEDPVPTLVKTPRWIGIIQPVFDFLGTVPGYREFDISFWFLLFLSIFFAMIIGDAGYGVLFLGLSIFARLKLKKAPAEPFFLLFVFSACTIIWGSLTGTWFGARQLVGPGSPLSMLVVPTIASFPSTGVDSGEMIKQICFMLGTLHLTIAHIKSFVRNLPRLRAFAQLGWLSVVWGMYFLIQVFVMARDFSEPAIGLLPGISLMHAFLVPVAFGLLLVILFGEQKGSFLKGVGLGLAWFPLRLLNAVTAFSDVVSYIRLFAVGLATVKVAEAFNVMALGVGFGGPLTGVGAALILFLGHALNIAMGSLSIIVHGVRLNVLEFSTHIGMEWTGIPYKPFRNSEVGLARIEEE